jgi:hypothetical protein
MRYLWLCRIAKPNTTKLYDDIQGPNRNIEKHVKNKCDLIQRVTLEDVFTKINNHSNSQWAQIRDYTLSQKRLMISLLIMKCNKHSSNGMKSFIPLDECLLHFIINNEISHRFWDSAAGCTYKRSNKTSKTTNYEAGSIKLLLSQCAYLKVRIFMKILIYIFVKFWFNSNLSHLISQ